MDDNNNHRYEKIALCSFSIFSFIFIMVNGKQIYSDINSLRKYFLKFPTNLFNKCIKYQLITQLVLCYYCILIGISSFILCNMMLFFQEIFFTKLYKAFELFNYYIFGPLLLGLTLLGFVYFNEITYNCEPNNYQGRHKTNLYVFVMLLIGLSISSAITLAFLMIKGRDKFKDSISFKDPFNYFIGKFFWFLSFQRHSNLNNNNNNENDINNNNDNDNVNKYSIVNNIEQ